MDQSVLSSCTLPLLHWYDRARRSLPFREDPQPYYIWVSEIMLQQTRVSAAVPYFERFVAELPDIQALADCEDERLLKLWQGLGYYNRVRNLQKGAREVCERFGGKLPADYDALRSITGIGDYTAGAIASIAFGLKTPAVDGNVLRVVSRITGDERDVTSLSLRREYADYLRPLMPDGREGDFTQALMELGALVCIPNGSPLCEECPLKEICIAKREQKTDLIPVKSAKKARRTEKRQVLLVLTPDGRVLLHKRPNKGLLAGLWEFPNFLETEARPDFLKECVFEQSLRAKHIFSHIEWHMQGYLTVAELQKVPTDYVLASQLELEEVYAIPGAFSAFLHFIRSRSDSD